MYDQQTPFAGEFGIDAGCQSAVGDAVPPVRLLEVAEAFAPAQGSNVTSVCAESYEPAMMNVANQLIENFEPACLDLCLAGGRGDDCVFTQAIPHQAEETVVRCDVGEDGSPRLPDDADVCVFVAVDDDRAEACIESNTATEFLPLFRAGVPRVPGTEISATCSVSENEAMDCPWVRG